MCTVESIFVLTDVPIVSSLVPGTYGFKQIERLPKQNLVAIIGLFFVLRLSTITLVYPPWG